ncbi:MAG: helix-turn-helix domain-containing protein [Solirubrobacteraceae bacterium]
MSTEPADRQPDVPQAAMVRNGAGPQTVGSRVRAERLRQRIGVRELARRVGVSASLISQVELGRASPSVATLYAIVNQLGLSLDELLLEQPAASDSTGRAVAAGDAPAAAPPAGQSWSGADGGRAAGAAAVDPVVRHGGGKAIQLASGVRWERLTPQTPQDVDFLSVRYEVGGASAPEQSLIRHSGHEYGHVLSGRLGVTIGFETYELGPGDSISFDSTMPHRLFNLGEAPAEAIWFVVGRRGDPRIVRGPAEPAAG